MNNYKQKSKLIKRPVRVVSHKRQKFNRKIRQKLAAAGDITLTPISRRSNMRPQNDNPRNKSTEGKSTKDKSIKDKSTKDKSTKDKSTKDKSTEEKPTKQTKKTRKKPVKRRTSGQGESGSEVFTKTLNKVRRKKWVPLNAKQKEYISDVMNSAISFAASTLPNSSEEISSLDSFLHAVKIKLMQQLSQIIVPPLSYSAIVGVDKLVNFSNIIQELDDRIETLDQAVTEQEELLSEKKQRRKSLNLTKS